MGNRKQLSRESDLRKTRSRKSSCLVPKIKPRKRDGEVAIHKRSDGEATTLASASDRISELPDDVLSQILSLLALKDAGRTSVLSHRWRHLWRYCSILDLGVRDILGLEPIDELKFLRDEAQFDGRRRTLMGEFVTRVENILQYHAGSGVEQFTVRAYWDEELACHLDHWVGFAIASRAKGIDISLDKVFDMEDFPSYSFPSHLLPGGNSSALAQLCLRNCTLKPSPDFDGFNSLRELALCQVDITDVDIHGTLSGCHALERLKVVQCHNLVNFKLSGASSRMKYLNVECCVGLKKIEFNGLNLVTFEYVGRKIRFDQKNAPHLTRARISSGSRKTHGLLDYVVDGFPHGLPRLETLVFSFGLIFQARILPPCTLKLNFLKHLILDFLGSWEEDVLWVADLLTGAPVLEKLDIELPVELGLTVDPQEMRRPSRFVHDHLKEITISGFRAERSQIELAIHLINSASSLEIMRISTRRKQYIGDCKFAFCERRGNRRVRHWAARYLAKEIRSDAKVMIS